MSNLLEVESFDQLQDLIATSPNLVIKYWATWCGPCRQFAPIVDKAAEKIEATFVAVDVDKVPEVVVEYGVQGVPAVHQWKGGTKVKELVGVQRLIPLIAELSD